MSENLKPICSTDRVHLSSTFGVHLKGQDWIGASDGHCFVGFPRKEAPPDPHRLGYTVQDAVGTPNKNSIEVGLGLKIPRTVAQILVYEKAIYFQHEVVDDTIRWSATHACGEKGVGINETPQVINPALFRKVMKAIRDEMAGLGQKARDLRVWLRVPLEVLKPAVIEVLDQKLERQAIAAIMPLRGDWPGEVGHSLVLSGGTVESWPLSRVYSYMQPFLDGSGIGEVIVGGEPRAQHKPDIRAFAWAVKKDEEAQRQILAYEEKLKDPDFLAPPEIVKVSMSDWLATRSGPHRFDMEAEVFGKKTPVYLMFRYRRHLARAVEWASLSSTHAKLHKKLKAALAAVSAE